MNRLSTCILLGMMTSNAVPADLRFVGGRTPADTHDGRDNVGLAVTAGKWDGATGTLSRPGAFAAYVPSGEGTDRVHVAGTEGGAWSGLFAVRSASPDELHVDPVPLERAGIVPTADANVSTSSGPWATMQKGCDAAPAGSTLLVSPGIYAEGRYLNINTARRLTLRRHGAGQVVVTSTTSDKIQCNAAADITFDGFTHAGPGVFLDVFAAGAAVTIRNCTLASASSHNLLVNGANVSISVADSSCYADNPAGHAIYLNAPGPTVAVRGGTLGSTQAGRHGIYVNTSCPYAAGTRIAIEGSRLRWNGTSSAVALDGTVASVSIRDCTFASPPVCATGVVGGTHTSYADLLEIEGCSREAGATLGTVLAREGGFRSVQITRNRFDSDYDGNRYIQLGVETVSDADEETNPRPFASVVIQDNTFRFSGTRANHLLLLAVGTDGTLVRGNDFVLPDSTASYQGLICKARSCLIEYNTFYGANWCLFLAGSVGCTVQHNTVVARTGRAFDIDSNQDRAFATPADPYGLGTSNVVRDNIFLAQASSPTELAYAHEANDEPGLVLMPSDWDNILDYNLYWSRGPYIASLGVLPTPTAGGAEALQARWRAYAATGSVSLGNDRHSRVADPLLADPAAGDFSLLPGSPCLGAASDGLSMGARQPAAPRSPDFDGDRDVDQEDFGRLQECLSADDQPADPPGCLGCDLNNDGRIDQADVALLLGCLSGPGIAADCLDEP